MVDGHYFEIKNNSYPYCYWRQIKNSKNHKKVILLSVTLTFK